MAGTLLRLGELAIRGRSRAGEETWFRVDPPGIGLDCGRGADAQVGVGGLLLTHGHLDHALGLPWLLSQRRLQGLGSLRILCPAPIAADLEAFLAAAESLERVRYEREIVACVPGLRTAVGRDLEVEAFAVDHVVPSLGYHLVRRRQKLRPELAGLPGAEIAARRRAGEAVEEEREEVWLSYCGDTGPGVFEVAPRLAESRILLIECTFLGAERREQGAAYGHLHLEDLAERTEDLAGCEAIVLHHLSRRHRPEELQREVTRLLPGLADRIHLLTAGDA